jgi:Protein of unknown function (DUF3306)
MSRPEDDGGFLGRWAKRKQTVQLEAKREVIAPLHQNDKNQENNKNQENDKNELQVPQSLQPAMDGSESGEVKLPMPSLDDVLPGGDVSMFLQKHVPDSLRNMALRKAWASDPEISTFIEMAENQWDFNNPDSIPGFSSTLEGIDLKAMVERVFNNVAPPQEDEPENASDEANLDGNELQEALPQPTENIIMDTKSTEKTENASVNRRKSRESEFHVAAQENTAESGIYDTPKKRHGSALPS